MRCCASGVAAFSSSAVSLRPVGESSHASAAAISPGSSSLRQLVAQHRSQAARGVGRGHRLAQPRHVLVRELALRAMGRADPALHGAFEVAELGVEARALDQQVERLAAGLVLGDRGPRQQHGQDGDCMAAPQHAHPSRARS